MIFVGIYGNSDSGKTELVKEITKILVEKGFSVGYIKHTPNGFDVEGKDTWRVFESSAKFVCAVAEEEFFVRVKGNYDLSNLENILPTVDVVIVEGFRKANIPKIKVGESPTEERTVFIYDNNAEEIADWIIKTVEKYRKFPVDLRVNGKKIPLNPYVQKVFMEVILALTNTLKGVEEPKEIDLKIKIP